MSLGGYNRSGGGELSAIWASRTDVPLVFASPERSELHS